MEKHPLYFFIDLIEGRKVTELRKSFLFVNPDLTVVAINEQEEYIQYLIEDNYQPLIGTSTFSDFINNRVSEKKGEVLTTIDLHFLNNPEIKSPNQFVSHIINSLNELILELDGYSDTMKYPVIGNTLIELKESLLRKYLTSELASEPTPTLASNTGDVKLQWNAGVASLCTLFYELANNYKLEKKGISFLTGSQEQLTKFILANFVDEEGNTFSESSIKTYIDSRTDKKAKRNKVDIDQIIPQSVKKS
jgi:hypothetical protein